MNLKCHGHDCDKMIEDNYYCDECYTELQNQKQRPHNGTSETEQEQKPKVNGAKLIHKAMFG